MSAGPLEHVCWIGGGSGAGKSTIARRLAARHGLACVSTDDLMAAHAARSNAADHPLLHAFMAMDGDQRWLTRAPQAMLETFHWFAGEGFTMIAQDLAAMPREPGIVVEGFRLLPHLVQPLAAPGRAVWLLPSPEFREAAFRTRAMPFLAATSDPARALANLLERDRLFTDRLRGETGRLGLPAIAVDGTMGEAALERLAAAALGLG